MLIAVAMSPPTLPDFNLAAASWSEPAAVLKVSPIPFPSFIF